MASLWPWLAVAGLGALHGLSPANGWMFAAAWGVRAGDATQARRALLPIAIVHATSVAVMAWVIAQGLSMDRALVQGLAGKCAPLTTGAIASGVCRGVARHPHLLSGTAPHHAWTAALAVTGLLLVASR